MNWNYSLEPTKDEEGIYTTNASERIYQTVTYACGCSMIRDKFRMNMSLTELASVSRQITEKEQFCRHCLAKYRRAKERQEERKRSA